MVDKIEELRTELKCHTLRQMCVLEERYIPVVQARNLDDIASRVAERAERSRLKTRGIKIAVDGSLAPRQVPVACAIRTLEGEPAHVRTISGYCDAEKVAGHE